MRRRIFLSGCGLSLISAAAGGQQRVEYNSPSLPHLVQLPNTGGRVGGPTRANPIPGQSKSVSFMTEQGYSLQITAPVLTKPSQVVFTVNKDASPINTPYQFYGDSIDDRSMIVQASPSVPFAATAPGAGSVEVWLHNKLFQRFTPTRTGDVRGMLDLSQEENGPLVLDVYSDSEPGAAVQLRCKQRVIMFIEGGKEHLSLTPPAAIGMSKVFEDDFTGQLSISANEPSATWYPLKPNSASGVDFGDAIFQDPDRLNGGENPFYQHGSFLRIRCKYDPNVIDPSKFNRKWTTGNIATGRPGGKEGFYAKVPYYAECRFFSPIGGVPWPAFWQLTRNALLDANANGEVETDTVENIGLFPNAFRQGGVFYPKGGGSKGRTAPGSDPGIFPTDSLCFDAHVYGVHVTKTLTTFYMDNIRMGQMPTDPYAGEGAREDYFMVDHALGGGGYGEKWNSTLPGSDHYDMWVDFVRVYTPA